MRLSPNGRRRPAVQISSARAARLHRLVMFLAQKPRTRDEVLRELQIGIRTFYRELELMGRCGIRVRHKDRAYQLLTTAEQAKGRLPFPDPQLSFAEMADLSRTPGAAGRRLAELLARVTRQPEPAAPRLRGRRGRPAAPTPTQPGP